MECSVKVHNDGKKLFIAIWSKEGLRPYRYARQKHTTITIRVAKPFMNLMLRQECKKYATTLDKLTKETSNNLISKIHLVKEKDEIIHYGGTS